MSSTWDELAEWWSNEVLEDPSYPADVHPILETLLPTDFGVAMDLGCGEGQGMRQVEGKVFGCDISLALLTAANAGGTVVQTRLPNLAWLATDMLDTAYSVYLVDLIEDHDRFFG